MLYRIEKWCGFAESAQKTNVEAVDIMKEKE